MTFSELAPVRAHLAGLPVPYWIAGGWAVDLFAGKVSREHSDVDVLVLARDLPAIAEAFPGLILVNEKTSERRPWQPGTELLPGRHTFVFAEAPAGPPIQLILAPAEGDEWVFHRGRGRIRRPLAEIGLVTEDGIPYLVPELVLMFKSRGRRDKDDADFRTVAGKLGPDRLGWLLDHLPRDEPDHPWLAFREG